MGVHLIEYRYFVSDDVWMESNDMGRDVPEGFEEVDVVTFHQVKAEFAERMAAAEKKLRGKIEADAVAARKKKIAALVKAGIPKEAAEILLDQ